MKTTTLSAIIGAVLASTAAAPAQTVTLNPTDDARVLATEPNNAAGGQHWLSLYHSGGNVQRIFLNFDLATYAGRALTTDATLTLRGHSAWGDYLTGVGLGTANAAWTEGTITWNNQPGITVVPGATNPAGNFPGNPDVPWTIPWYVVEKWATDGYHGIGLTSGSGSRLHFQSKEHPDNNPPRLEFTHTDSADGVWTNGAGNWTDAGNWQGGNVARGIDRSATFHGFTAATATLDADHTVGSLSFDNADHAIAAGGGRLALSTTAGTPSVFVGTGRTASIAAPILGLDGLAKTGAGTLVLSGNNTYTGGTTVSDGTLSVGALADSGTSHLGPSGTLTFDGGTLRYTGAGGTTNRNVAFPGAGTIEVAAGSALSLLGKWTGNGGITKTGDGTLTVGNNYTSSNRFNIGSDSGGAFTMEAGTLIISPSNYFTLGDNGQNASYTQTGGAANFTAPSGTYIGNGNSGTSTFTVSGGMFTQTQNVMRVGQNGSSVGILTVGGGAGTATVSAPTVTLGSNNAAASGTVNLLANGRLITGAVNKGSGTGTFNFDGGTLQPIASNSTFMQGLTAAYVNAGGANIDTAGHDVAIAQPLLDGGGGLTKSGDGILTLTGANSYIGGTEVNSGTLRINAPGSLPTAGTTTVNAPGTLNLLSGGTNTYGNNFDGNGRILVTFSGGTNNTYLSGNSTGFTGTLELAGSGGNKFNTSGLKISPSAAIKINSGAQMFLSGGVNLANPIEVTGTGNTENRGAIRLTSGTLSGTVTLLGNTTIGPEGGSITGNIISGAAGTQVLTLGTTSSLGSSTYSGVIGGGTGTIALRVLNSNSGHTIIPGGSLNTYTGGTTLLHGPGSGTRLRIDGISGTPYGSGPITIGLAPTDRAGIFFTTAGQTLANDLVVNTARGTDRPGIRSDRTDITLSGTVDANLAPATFSTNGTGSFRLTGQVTGASGITLHNQYGSSISVTLANTTGNPNNYQGDTVIQGTKGSVNLGAAEQIPHGPGAGNLVNHGALNMNGFTETINGLTGTGTIRGNSGTPVLTVGANDASSDFSGTLQDAGGTLSLTKTGSGTLTLAGAGTYTGPTTINAGTLMLNGSLGSTAVAVNSGGTLGGTGSIGGVVTVNAGGTHAPGASVGSQPVGGETWMSGGRFEFEINDALGQPGGPVGWDELLVGGTLDLTNLSAQDPFYIDIVSLSGAAPGDIDNFVATEPVEWPFLRYETLAGDFSGDLFSVDSSQFSNPTGQGHFRVVQMEYEGADWLAIGYVPEPGAWLLLLSAAACGLLVRRRK